MVLRLLKQAWPVVGLLLPLALIVLLADQFGSISVERSVTEALIKVVTVVGLYIFIGNSGVVSFGSVSFMAIAAYATAWQTCCSALKPITMSGLPDFLRTQTYPVLPAGIAAAILASIAAFIVGLILMRLSGIAASISTLAALFILNVVYSNWDKVTMGTASIVGLPTYVTPWLAFACAGLAMVIAYLFQISSWGLALRATREDEVAARASGISVYWMRLAAFTLSGLVMGIAGVLHAHFLGTISVDTFFLGLTFITLTMLVVGGMRSLSGAVLGVVVISFVTDILRRMESGFSVSGQEIAIPAGSQEVVLAVVMLLVLIFRRDGLTKGREFAWPFARRQRISETKNGDA